MWRHGESGGSKPRELPITKQKRRARPGPRVVNLTAASQPYMTPLTTTTKQTELISAQQPLAGQLAVTSFFPVEDDLGEAVG